MLSQPTLSGFTVWCNNMRCDARGSVPPLPTPGEIRQHILKFDWYIDLHSDQHSFLIGREGQIPNGLLPDDLQRLINNSDYPIERDQHYCSLECAGEDA